jgi:hypothetical protein
VKKVGGRWLGRCSICPTAKDRRTDWKYWQCSKWVCKNHTVKKIQIKCESFQQQSDKFHSNFCSKLYLLVFKNICISLCIVAWEIKHFNKSNFCLWV